jgi:hypothetical protein
VSRQIAYAVTPAAVPQLSAVPADKASPQGAGTTITWTAQAGGGEPPLLYRFWRKKTSVATWTLVQDWSAASSYGWTPAVSDAATWQLRAEVRSEAAHVVQVTKEAATMQITPYPPVVIDSFTADRSSPSLAWRTIQFSASASGGSGTLLYRYLRSYWDDYDGSWSWSVTRDWNATPAVSWTPTGGYSGSVRVEVWTSQATHAEATRELAWTVTEVSVPSIAAVTADKPSPQGAGTTITWTAQLTGGEPPVLLRFWRRKSGTSSWTLVQEWSATSTYAWTPQPPDQGDWQIKVEARGEAVTAVQSTKESAYLRTTVGPPAVIESITVQPAQPGVWTAVTLTPVTSGGVAPLQVRWWAMTYDDYEGSWSWSVIRNRSAQAAYSWTPQASSSGTWEFRAEVMSAGSTVIESEKTVSVTAWLPTYRGSRSSTASSSGASCSRRSGRASSRPCASTRSERRFERRRAGALPARSFCRTRSTARTTRSVTSSRAISSASRTAKASAGSSVNCTGVPFPATQFSEWGNEPVFRNPALASASAGIALTSRTATSMSSVVRGSGW